MIYTKQSPLCQEGYSRTIKPTLNYIENKKVVNPYVLARERIILAKAFSYSFFKPLRYELIDPRHKVLYFNLQCFFDCFPVSSRSCNSLIKYLREVGTLQICGDESYIRSLFGGLGYE